MENGSSRHPGMAVVYTEQGLLRAQVIKAKLEEAGIPVLLDYESAGPVIGITVDGLGEVRILVPARQAHRARRLIVNRRLTTVRPRARGKSLQAIAGRPRASR